MSREIKFRAFIKNEIGGFMITSDNSDCFMVSNGNGFVVYDENKNTLEDSEFELMQFTGLKDKHNKEIYEGDICKHNEDISEIKYWEGAFIFNKYATHNYSLTNFACCRTFEVIGNIYENPELLTN